MEDLLDLDRYPLDRLECPGGRALIDRCRDDLGRAGMFSLEGLVHPSAIGACASALATPMAEDSFTHRRRHNIYFAARPADVAADHPAFALCETVNHTLCADQLRDGLVLRLYEWPPLSAFLAAVLGKASLHVMADPLARANVMAYRAGEALNWHFDRSEFTTTLLIQAAESGGTFQYRSDLRSEDDPNLEGVARLLRGDDPEVRTLDLAPGTLNVFKGKNTAHRVTPVVGARDRMVAVLSYYDRPGVRFSEEEQVGFYGRAA